MITIPLSKQGKNAGKYEAIVDDCDADLAELRWSVQDFPNTRTYYARGRIEPNINRQYCMHRVILSRMLDRPLDEKEQVDHINGNGLNNRRENLRLATQSQNQMNTSRNSNNKSGYRGVYWDEQRKKWSAQITADGKYRNLGRFNTPEEAHAAYCEAAKEYHGDFANNG